MKQLAQIIIIIFTFLFGRNISENNYPHSSVVEIPNLSFVERTYSGLDILEQMDFSLLKQRNIAVLTNHTAVNRNGKHILDLIYGVENSKVLFILEFENGLWGRR